MPTSMPTSTIGRWLAAGCLILVGLAITVAGALSTPSGDADRASIDHYAAHLSRVDGSLTAEIFVVFLGAATALAALLARPRSNLLAGIAGWLGIISGSAWVMLVAVDFVTRAAVKTDRNASVQLLKNLTSMPQLQIFVVLALLGGLVSMVCLGIALWRSQAVPAWAAATFVIYEPVNILTGDAGQLPRAIAGLILLVGFAACALTILGVSAGLGQEAGDHGRQGGRAEDGVVGQTGQDRQPHRSGQ
jgi:hypothetical protein